MVKNKDLPSLPPIQPTDDLNEENIRFRYELEQTVMNAITAGNYEAIRSLFENDLRDLPVNPIIRRIPGDILRDRKNGLIRRNTFSRIAAREGGLPPVYLHLLSEKYSLKIEQATSVVHLDTVVAKQMMKEYCEAVNQFSTLGYSETIQKIISHISSRPTEPVLLNDVASEFHMNASHLSRKFKKETGITFIDYVIRQRIEYAKLLFHENHYTITEVASNSGFNSSSYFSKVFKKATGLAPKEYVHDIQKN